MIIVIGIAGVGKTSFVSKLASTLHETHRKPYVINLDPACRRVSSFVNIAIIIV